MSDNLTAAAAALNAPETIVQRSAEARAKATGAGVDDILAAWAGGGAAPTPAATPAPAAPPEPEPAAETVPEAAPAATAVAVAEPPAPGPAPEPEAPAPEVPPPPVEEGPMEAAPLAVRRRVAGRIGLLAGAATGLVVPLVFAPLLITRASLAETESPFSPAVELGPLAIGSGEEPFQLAGNALAVIGLLLLFAVAGIAIAHLSRTITAWQGRGMALRGGIGTTTAVGGGVGAVVGIITGALVSGPFAAPLEGAEGFTLIPLLTGAVVVILGGAVMGWSTGQLVQVLGVPEGEVAEDPDEAETVRRRLGSAFALPVVGLAGILLAVLPSAYVFLAFPSFAPVMAMIISGAILAFAGLAASRPGTKVTRGEFIAAAAAIGVVVIIILAVLNAVGAGHGGEEEEGEGESEPEAVLVIS